MATVNIHEAKTQLSKLIEAVAHGQEVIIAKAGKPVARLVPLATSSPACRPGLMKGKLRISDNFDAPLPAEIQAPFDGTCAV